TEMSSVSRQACGPLDAFRRFRETSPSLIAEQERFALNNDTKNCEPLNALPRARVRVDMKLEDVSVDFALLAFETTAEIQVLIPSRSVFEEGRTANPDFAPLLGNGVYRVSFCLDQQTANRTNPNGVVGLVLVKGKGPFNLGLDPKLPDTLGLNPNADDVMP